MRLRTIIRPFTYPILYPLARFYLRKTRRSRYKGLTVSVPTGVFHPGMYLSTRFMIRHVAKHALTGKRLWEVGAGSGMVAIFCAKQGAIVTATDINPKAVEAIAENAQQNRVPMTVLLADLYAGLPAEPFDWILVNPPYYPRDPQSETEMAFFCGAEFQYFERFFSGLQDFCMPTTEVRMVLSEDCNLERIREIGKRAGWVLVEVDQMRKLGEYNFIYALRRQ